MFDILTIAILALFSLIGLVRGWPSVAVTLLSWLLSFLIALMASSYIASIGINWFVEQNNENIISDSMIINNGSYIEILVGILLFGLCSLVVQGLIRGSVLYDRTHDPVDFMSGVAGFFLGALQGVIIIIVVYGVATIAVGREPNNFVTTSTANFYLAPTTKQIVSWVAPTISDDQKYKSLLNIFLEP